MSSETASHLRHMTSHARHARNVFVIAAAICVVLALDNTFVSGAEIGQLAAARSTFGPLMLWALTAAAYAFYLLARTNAGMAPHVEGVLEADHSRALRQLASIRRRLRATKKKRAH